jgi:hypothetical protein
LEELYHPDRGVRAALGFSAMEQATFRMVARQLEVFPGQTECVVAPVQLPAALAVVVPEMVAVVVAAAAAIQVATAVELQAVVALTLLMQTRCLRLALA